MKDFILDTYTDNINFFERKNKLKINIENEDNMQASDYTIKFETKNKKIIEKIKNVYEARKSMNNISSLDKKYNKFRQKKYQG